MNELDLLIQLRDEVPLTEPSVAVERVIFESLRGAAGHPARQPARGPFQSRGRAVMAGAAAFAVGAATILAIELSRPGPNVQPGPHPATVTLGRARTEAQLLDYATRAATATPAFVPRPHQWVYVKTEVAASSAGGGGFLFGPPNERVIGQAWTRVDQLMFASYVRGHLQFSPGGPGTTLGGWKSISPSYLNSLPTNPARLEAVMLASNSDPRMPWYTGPDKNYRIFSAIFTLMSAGETDGTWVPPKLQAAMYRVLARLHGVHFDATTDLAGRSGMGFYMVTGGWEKQELVINPVTYAYMGDEWVAIRAHTAVGTDGTRSIRKGQVLGWSALLKTAVVQQAGQLP